MAIEVNNEKTFTVKIQRVEFGPAEMIDVIAIGRDDARTKVLEQEGQVTILDCWEANVSNPYKGR